MLVVLLCIVLFMLSSVRICAAGASQQRERAATMGAAYLSKFGTPGASGR